MTCDGTLDLECRRCLFGRLLGRLTVDLHAFQCAQGSGHRDALLARLLGMLPTADVRRWRFRRPRNDQPGSAERSHLPQWRRPAERQQSSLCSGCCHLRWAAILTLRNDTEPSSLDTNAGLKVSCPPITGHSARTAHNVRVGDRFSSSRAGTTAVRSLCLCRPSRFRPVPAVPPTLGPTLTRRPGCKADDCWTAVGGLTD